MKSKVFFTGFLFAAFFTLAMNNVNAETSAKNFVKGIVADNTTNSPLGYSSVAVFNKDNELVPYGTIADANGNFQIKNLPYGNYYLVAYSIGYHKKHVFNIEINRKHNKINTGRIMVGQDSNNLFDVEIFGER
jgi:hypothetical protein